MAPKSNRTVQKNPTSARFRTVACRHWRRGNCNLGNECNFRHDPEMLATEDPNSKAPAFDGISSQDSKGFKLNPQSRPFEPTAGAMFTTEMSTPMAFPMILNPLCSSPPMIPLGQSTPLSPAMQFSMPSIGVPNYMPGMPFQANNFPQFFNNAAFPQPFVFMPSGRMEIQQPMIRSHIQPMASDTPLYR